MIVSTLCHVGLLCQTYRELGSRETGPSEAEDIHLLLYRGRKGRKEGYLPNSKPGKEGEEGRISPNSITGEGREGRKDIHLILYRVRKGRKKRKVLEPDRNFVARLEKHWSRGTLLSLVKIWKNTSRFLTRPA